MGQHDEAWTLTLTEPTSPARSAVSRARSELGHRSQIVHSLQVDKARLEQRLGSSTSLATLSREARALGYVRPGEHLFIVKGIQQWRKRERASMMGRHGRG